MSDTNELLSAKIEMVDKKLDLISEFFDLVKENSDLRFQDHGQKLLYFESRITKLEAQVK